MKSRKQKPPPRDWTKTTPYAALALLATLITAAAGAYKAVQPQGPFPPSPTPTASSTPSPTPSKTPHNLLTDADVERQRKICNEWASKGSGKLYNFVCQTKDTFDIYVRGVHGSERTGTGRILEENRIETDVTVVPRTLNAIPRNSHWKLKLSDDGKRLTGIHSGDDPRETFSLVLVLVQSR